MSKKRIVFFVLVFFMILFGLETMRGRAKKSELREGRDYETYSRHYVMITGKRDADAWDKVYESALKEGKKQGAYVERLGYNLAKEYDQKELLQIALEASVDGILIPGNEEKETVELINEAVEKNIPVVTMLRDCTGSRRQCFVGINSYNMGQEYGQQILEIMEQDGREEVKVVLLADESKMDSSQNLVLLGIRETLEKSLGEECPVTVETVLVDNTRSFNPEESIRDIFLDKDRIPDILICMNAVYTQCAYQAVVDYNKVGTVQILGCYDSDTILDAVAKNIIYSTITLDAEQMGELCVNALQEYLDTGYTNGYRAVDTRLIREEDARKLSEAEPLEE